jgi:hypothetical protein
VSPDNSQWQCNPCFHSPLHARACSQRVVDNVQLDVGEGEVHNPRNIAPDSSAAQRCKGLRAAPRPIICCMRAHKYRDNFALTPMPTAPATLIHRNPLYCVRFYQCFKIIGRHCFPHQKHLFQSLPEKTRVASAIVYKICTFLSSLLFKIRLP